MLLVCQITDEIFVILSNYNTSSKFLSIGDKNWEQVSEYSEITS